jgi:hypothetical protein
MKKGLCISTVSGIVLLGLVIAIPCLRAGETSSATNYQVLAPIRHGNLTIFPVIFTSRCADTGAITVVPCGVPTPRAFYKPS